ncbi:MAG: hypothetical protein A7316_01260 [Candidatus Altiarchaeales archaeon WOR_SM1_86-2]|nr:MAG: hypothetical protein A7316_01260 [Candidatus Altiarchaeales archaeon WOR_SM1_86-2]
MIGGWFYLQSQYNKVCNDYQEALDKLSAQSKTLNETMERVNEKEAKLTEALANLTFYEEEREPALMEDYRTMEKEKEDVEDKLETTEEEKEHWISEYNTVKAEKAEVEDDLEDAENDLGICNMKFEHQRSIITDLTGMSIQLRGNVTKARKEFGDIEDEVINNDTISEYDIEDLNESIGNIEKLADEIYAEIRRS